MSSLQPRHNADGKQGRVRMITLQQNYSDVIMSAMVFQITSVRIVSPTVCSGADQR